jgi:gallate 1-beta-glucosyltransferase
LSLSATTFNTCHPRIIALLLRVFFKSSQNKTVCGDLLKPNDDCIEWLNSKPTSSVVYISFGSIVYLKQDQIDEIAYGLLQSGVSFLWVMKPPHKDSGKQPHVLPDGILEKTKSRGKVVRWSPQEQVLAHRSIACFVTHCGWRLLPLEFRCWRSHNGVTK